MKRKNIANQVLAGVVLLFAIASMLKHFYRDSVLIQLFSFVAEAAVVGGVADWFAVTALFRKPLGFPWHTALITRQRERVIKAIVDMIQNELLSVESIKKRMDKVSLTNLFIDWVENKDGKVILKQIISQYSRDMLDHIDIKKISVYVDEIVNKKARETKLTEHVQAIAQWAMENKRYEQLLGYIIDEAICIIEKSNFRQLIYERLVKIREQQTKSIFEKAVFWLAEQSDSINLGEAADAIYEELIIILHEVKKKDHVLYQWANSKLIEVIDQLEHQDVWSEEIEKFKQTIVRSIDVPQIVEENAQTALQIIRASSNSAAFLWIYDQIKIYWGSFVQNQQAQNWLELSIKQALYKVIENEHQLIGTAVQNVLANFSDEDLNQFIEEKAGDDLQWIRINGCVVGGAVGFVMFLFLHYFYDVYVVPIIQGWL